jgi:hypothetical protein
MNVAELSGPCCLGFPSVELDPFDAAPVWGRGPIDDVGGCRYIPKVCNPIIRPAAIDVIDLVFGEFPMYVEPGKTMGSELLLPERYVDIAFSVYATGEFPSVPSVPIIIFFSDLGLPMEKASLWIIVQTFAKTGGGQQHGLAPYLLDKRADGESDKGVGTLNRRPQLTDSRRGEVAGGFKERCGQVVDNRKCRPSEGVEGSSIACPLTETDTIASGFTVPDLNGNASRRGLG